MATPGFNELIVNLANFDVFTSILPFILSFILFYFTLDNLPIFSDEEQFDKFGPVIALIMAFFVARFLVANPVYQQFFVGYFGRIVVGMVGLLGLLVFLGFVGVEVKSKVPLITFLVLGGTVAAFAMSKGLYAFFPNASIPFANMTWQDGVDAFVNSGLVYIFLIIAMLYWAFWESDSDDETALGKLLGDAIE